MPYKQNPSNISKRLPYDDLFDLHPTHDGLSLHCLREFSKSLKQFFGDSADRRQKMQKTQVLEI